MANPLGPLYELPDTRPRNAFAEAMMFGKHNVVAEGGYIRSEDFDGDREDGSGSTVGWYIGGNGTIVINEGEFRGAISAGTIDIGGSDATSFHVDASGNMWLGDAAFASAPFKVSSAGALTAASATVTGTIRTAVSGERVEMDTTDQSTLKFYTGDGSETNPGRFFIDIQGSGAARQPYLYMQAPTFTDSPTFLSAPAIQLTDESPDNSQAAYIVLATANSNIQIIEGGDISIDPVANILLSSPVYIQGEAVTFGAADSAGAGFRLLRVPN